MDRKLLYMGIAGLILLIAMLICGGDLRSGTSPRYRSHTQEIDVPQSSLRIEFLAMRTRGSRISSH